MAEGFHGETVPTMAVATDQEAHSKRVHACDGVAEIPAMGWAWNREADMETIHLIGAEDVARAGSTIASAADRMSQAAASIDETLTRFTRNMEEMISRAEAAAQSVDRLAASLEIFNAAIEKTTWRDDLHRECPGCIDCGPPIAVKADQRCGKGS